MADLIIKLIEAAARLAGLSREAFAKKLEDAAADIRARKLLPDEAFARAQDDQDRLADLYGKATD